MFTIDQIEAFTNAYIYAALWSSTDEINGELIEGLEDYEVSEQFKQKASVICSNFVMFNDDLLSEALEYPGYDMAMAGHDLGLTRCGHGAGYWDRNLEDTGEYLTKAAEACGTGYVYIGDDGQVYHD